MKKRIRVFIIGFFLWLGPMTPASSAQGEPKKLSLKGYVKYLTAQSIDSKGNTIGQHFFHNRMNFRYDATSSLTARVELRNRFFFGEFLKYYPFPYGDLLEQDNGLVDMSWSIVNSPNAVFNTTVDRAYLNWTNEKWDISLGRQRINWGINVAWNPNDLFNVLNFTDFDYIERPGSDALRIQRYLSGMSHVEVAYKHDKDYKKSVAAALYRFNKDLYDVQFLVGKYQTDLAVGTGWAGSIKNTGFKGEVTAFQNIINSVELDPVLVASIAADYSFRNGLYLNGSFLYNSTKVGDITQLLAITNTSTQLSVKQLMPNHYSAFGQVSHTFTPLFTGSMAVMYGIDLKAMFIMPSLAYSLTEEFDLSLVGQSFVVMVDGLDNAGSAIFLRLQWSY